MNAITTRDLTRRFGKLVAVDRLNLKIEAGVLYGLIGPNGAGKTTTLRMLAGLLEPTSGEIRINELALRQYWNEIQWQIGYMPDFFGVYEDLLVWEYLDFFARCYQMPASRRTRVINELLELVDLTDKRDEAVQTLSRGMRQRLCLAHALVHDPQVLLLDEPASGLDPRARVEMRELLRELQAMGKTIILSSHILSELAELCDSIGVIEHGHLVASGSMEQIRQQIQSDRVFHLRILSDLQKAENALQSFVGVKEIQTLNGNANLRAIHFAGDDNDAADLLSELITQGVRVASFSETNADLEQIFLRLTKGYLE
jgi:ABC-2 type transport system ATP-binding protein